MPTIVTPPAYENPCSEVWFDPAMLSSPDPDLSEQAAIGATWVLWTLSGERFHGDQCWIEDYRTISGYCNIELRQWPVAEVHAVSTVDVCGSGASVGATGLGTIVEGWCDKGNGLIKVCGSSGSNFGFTGCGCGGGSIVRVHYTTSNNLPPGSDRAAFRLAEEYLKAYQGLKCSLPERITSVARQNVNWTILDPQDFLSDGLSGIGPVDQWLATVGLRSRWFRFTDPLKSVPLAASTLFGCGDDDCFADLIPMDT